MATIRTVIQVQDNMSRAFQSMNNAMNIVISSFEQLQRQSSNAVDTASIQAARRELNSAEIAFNSIEQGINQASEAQQQFNQNIHDGESAADGLISKVKTLVGAYLGIQGIKKGAGIINDWLGSADVINTAEKQLANVMINMGAVKDEFELIREKASQVEGKSTYGAEALLAGAGEIATYLESGKAIESMMDTMANYAAGMGGINVDDRQMVEYATQLGKALDGQFDGLRKKGFDVTDAQKAIIEKGTEMERVAVITDIIAQSWDGLAESLANTPQGQIVQMQNNFDGIKQKVGNELYPAVLDFFNIINSNMPTIEALMMGFANAASTVMEVLGYIIDVASSVATVVIDNWSWIEPIIWGIVAAAGAYAIALGIQTAATWLATEANRALIVSMLTNPITIIAVAIGILVGIIYKWVQSVGGIRIAWQIAMNAILTWWDIVKIGIFTGVYWILDLWDKLRLGFATSSVAIQNLMGNMKVGVLLILQNMVNEGIDIINGFIDTLNKIPGVSIEAIQKVSFGAEAQIENEAKKQARMKELNDLRNDIAANIAERDNALTQMKKDAVNAMAERQSAIAAAQAENAKKKEKSNPWDEIMSNLGNRESTEAGKETAKNTAKMAKSMEASEEDLKYLRDVAERDVINKFTTAEVKVDLTNNNNVNSNMDIDGIIDRFGEKLVETLDSVAEGV